MIYLDNAATSFPKPLSVTREMARCMRCYCGNPGRSSHALARAAAEKIYECRDALGDFLGCPSPENVIFTMNATMAINIALKGILQPGDHVLISDMEHNAVLRPIERLSRDGRIQYDVFPTFPRDSECTPERICAAILERIRPNTRLLVAAHASNICSASLPVSHIGAFCRSRGILLLVDASQSAGHLPLHMGEMQIDLLCIPGHKGLMGPQGTGALLLADGIRPDTLLEGGSGFGSLAREMPEEPPERYEAGTLPTPGIAGLLEGIREVSRIGIEQIHDTECRLIARLIDRLAELPGITLYAPHHSGGVLLFSADGIPSERLAGELASRGVCVRAGLHCAPLAHQTLLTPSSGAVRVSPSYHNTIAQIDAFADLLEEIL